MGDKLTDAAPAEICADKSGNCHHCAFCAHWKFSAAPGLGRCSSPLHSGEVVSGRDGAECFQWKDRGW